MSTQNTYLSDQEITWLLERRIHRLSDNKEVQIYPMGAERYLASILSNHTHAAYPIKQDIEGKQVLLIPGYGNSAFLFAEAGAASVSVYDKDPVTLAWNKAFKRFYHFKGCSDSHQSYPSIGALLNALTRWYPPLITLPLKKNINKLHWIISPNTLRKTYLYYMITLIQKALKENVQHHYELNKDISFHTGTVDDMICNSKKPFDTAFVPYLLGVKNGIESEYDIVDFIKKILPLMPQGHLIISPSQHIKEYKIAGKSYFNTGGHARIADIPNIKPYLIKEDPFWFRAQGLVVLSSKQKETPRSN